MYKTDMKPGRRKRVGNETRTEHGDGIGIEST
jgi:hypothetical protein